jgi:hypothetical protein
MKTLLVIGCVSGLNGAFLYPLLMWGSGRPLQGLIEAGLLAVGVGCLYLLYRFRRSL